LGLGRRRGAMGQVLAFPLQRCVEPPVDEVAYLYESDLVAHVVGYLQRVEDHVGSAIVERLAVRLMVAMCYQLGDRVVDELINELEAMQHAETGGSACARIHASFLGCTAPIGPYPKWAVFRPVPPCSIPRAASR